MEPILSVNGQGPRKNDPESLKQRLFASALAEFSEAGLKGTRLEQAATTKRTAVFNFKNKETLYFAMCAYAYPRTAQYRYAAYAEGGSATRYTSNAV